MQIGVIPHNRHLPARSNCQPLVIGVSVGPRAGGLFLTISNPNAASAFGDAGFGELDLSAQWRIYSCSGRASLADLDPPGFLSRAYSYATAIAVGATSTATPAPARGRYAWIYWFIGLCPQTAMTETTAMLQDVTAGPGRRSAYARCMDAQSIVAAGDHANRAPTCVDLGAAYRRAASLRSARLRSGDRLRSRPPGR